MMRPRSLFLAAILNRGASAQWATAKKRYVASMRANRLRYRDIAAERWLETT
jgi:hypothetical protein